MKKLSEYKSLSEVPLKHPGVKFKCMCPAVICGDAVGKKGCLGLDHTTYEECQFMEKK